MNAEISGDEMQVVRDLREIVAHRFGRVVIEINDGKISWEMTKKKRTTTY